MERNLIEQREIGHHRIKIYYDEDAFCPCTDWDLAALYLFEYSSIHQLHRECNWKKLFSGHEHTMNDALMKLANDYVGTKNIIKFFKKGTKENRLVYNPSSKMWELQYLVYRSDEWRVLHEFDAPYMNNGGWNGEMLDVLKNNELIELIRTYGKDIFICEWETKGYCQGDLIKGIAYCTKDRFKEMVENNTKGWKKRMDSLVESEVHDIGMWMWGDVKGFRLEKKVEFTKTYKDGRESEEDFEWEEVDSCWGYFMETEELIEEVISEHELKEEVA